MNDDDFNNMLIAEAFWVYLCYFLSFVLVATGYCYHWQSWIYYGIGLFIIGVLLNINSKVSRIHNLLFNAELVYQFKEDDDELEE